MGSFIYNKMDITEYYCAEEIRKCLKQFFSLKSEKVDR